MFVPGGSGFGNCSFSGGANNGMLVCPWSTVVFTNTSGLPGTSMMISIVVVPGNGTDTTMTGPVAFGIYGGISHGAGIVCSCRLADESGGGSGGDGELRRPAIRSKN